MYTGDVGLGPIMALPAVLLHGLYVWRMRNAIVQIRKVELDAIKALGITYDLPTAWHFCQTFCHVHHCPVILCALAGLIVLHIIQASRCKVCVWTAGNNATETQTCRDRITEH